MAIKVKYSKSWRRNLNATIHRDERKDSAKYKRKREETDDVSLEWG